MKTSNIMKKIVLVSLALMLCGVSAASAARIRVRVADFRFGPRMINARVGDVIVWQWVNGMHTTTSTTVPAGAQPWNSLIDSTHTEFRYRVQVAGNYRYQCNFHAAQGMRGTIVVSPASPGRVPATN